LKELYNKLINEDSEFRKELQEMALNLDRLASEVTRVTTVHASAMALLTKLTGELEAVSAELAAKAAQSPPVIDTAPLDALIDELKNSTDALAGAVADSSDVKPVVEVILHADDPTVPTVSVIMPEVLPEHVDVAAEVIVDTVDPASTEPQIAITVEPATEPVEADAVTATIETAPKEVDVLVEAPAEVHSEVLAETGVDVVEAVKEAFEATPEVTAELAPTVETIINADDPTVPTVAVIMPEVLPEHVDVSAEVVVDAVDPASTEPQVVITVEPATEPVEASAVVDKIETVDGQVDVLVEAPADVHADVKTETGVDIVEAVKEAFEAAPEVTAEPVAEAPAADAPVTP